MAFKARDFLIVGGIAAAGIIGYFLLAPRTEAGQPINLTPGWNVFPSFPAGWNVMASALCAAYGASTVGAQDGISTIAISITGDVWNKSYICTITPPSGDFEISEGMYIGISTPIAMTINPDLS